MTMLKALLVLLFLATGALFTKGLQSSTPAKPAAMPFQAAPPQPPPQPPPQQPYFPQYPPPTDGTAITSLNVTVMGNGDLVFTGTVACTVGFGPGGLMVTVMEAWLTGRNNGYVLQDGTWTIKVPAVVTSAFRPATIAWGPQGSTPVHGQTATICVTDWLGQTATRTIVVP